MSKTRFVAILSLLVPVVVGAGATRTSAATGTPMTLSLFTQSQVTSSTGERVNVELQVSKFVQFAGDPPLVFFSVSKANEIHNWTFVVSATQLSYDEVAGTGTVTSQQSLEPYADINLSLARSGDAVHSDCGRGATRMSQPVSVTGTVSLRTHTAWGTISLDSTPGPFSQSAEIDSDFGSRAGDCIISPECLHYAEADSSPTSHGFLALREERRHGKLVSSLVWNRIVFPRNAPGGMDRTDVIFARIPPVKARRAADGGVRIRGRAGHARNASGSATVTATGPPTVKADHCVGRPQKQFSWKHASYRNGSHPLTLRAEIGGDLRSRNLPHRAQIDFIGIRPPAIPRAHR